MTLEDGYQLRELGKDARVASGRGVTHATSMSSTDRDTSPATFRGPSTAKVRNDSNNNSVGMDDSLLDNDGSSEAKKSDVDPEQQHLAAGDRKEQLLPDEPVIRTGRDVSLYLVRFDDAGDPSLTLRSFVLGNFFLVVSSAVAYTYTTKPVNISLSNVFVQLAVWLCGIAWARLLPTEDVVANRPRLSWLKRTLKFINPGPFGIKEHVVATIIGTSGLNGAAGTDVLGVIKLFYHIPITPLLAFFGLFSISIMGVGLVGILRPLIIYPSAAVYYYTLPMVAIFQMLHYEAKGNRIRNFGLLFAGTCVWEPIVAYICPWLNGVSVFCLASMGAPMNIRRHIARIFGGASPNQGMAFFSLSFDPQYVSPSTYAGFPLKWQVMYWAGMYAGAIIMLIIYYTDTWQAKSLPFLSRTLFKADGTVWPQDEVFDGASASLNEEALARHGAPRLTASTVWAYFAQVTAIGALVTHILLFQGKDMLRFIREHRTNTHHDPHYMAMRKYAEVPQWIYIGLFSLAIGAALIVITLSPATLPIWSFVIAMLAGSIMTPISALLYSQYGSSVATNMMSKMLAGALRPGRPIELLLFSTWCHQLVNITVSLGDFMKVAIYTKVPHRIMLGIQVWATVVGAFLGWAILSKLIEEKRDILLDPIGDEQFSGHYYQNINSQAVAWALTHQMFSYGANSGYEIVPFGILIGALIPVIHWLCFLKIGWVRQAGEMITTPLFLYYLQDMSTGINSNVTMSVILGVTMQLYLRVRKPAFFREYCYLLAGAIDGAAELIVVILSFAVMGGNGHKINFPTWFGNPSGSSDHCVDTRSY